MRLTLEDLDDLESREREASLAPWYQASWKNKDKEMSGTEMSKLLCHFHDEGEPRFWEWEKNGEFVAALRNAAPELIRLARVALNHNP